MFGILARFVHQPNGISSASLVFLIVSNVLTEMELKIIKVFLCQTQDVAARATHTRVKLVTKVSEILCGTNRRDGYVTSTLFSRSLMTKFYMKSQYMFLSTCFTVHVVQNEGKE